MFPEGYIIASYKETNFIANLTIANYTEAQCFNFQIFAKLLRSVKFQVHLLSYVDIISGAHCFFNVRRPYSAKAIISKVHDFRDCNLSSRYF